MTTNSNKLSGKGPKDSGTVALAIVGCGEVAFFKHLPALQRVHNMRVVAVADIDPEKRKRVAERFKIDVVVPDIDSLLEIPGLDAIGICVPPAAHLEVGLRALAANKHTWIDKSLALTTADCHRLIEAEQESSARCMVGLHMRWHRLVREAKQMIAGGVVGKVESVGSVWSSPRKDFDLPEWRTKQGSGGGAITEIGVHHFDLWRYLLGDEVEQVFARSQDGLRDDEYAVVSARTAGGILCTARLSERATHQIEIEITGPEGRLRVDCLRFDGLEHYVPSDRSGGLQTRFKRVKHFLATLPGALVTRQGQSDYLDSYVKAWQHFADMIQHDEAVEATLLDGLRSVEITRACVDSSHGGGPVGVGDHSIGGSSQADPHDSPSTRNLRSG